MATVEIYEHNALRAGIQAPSFPIEAKQVLTIGSTTATSSAFDRATNFITAMSTAAFRFVIDATPTSTMGHAYWPGETPLHATVISGHKFIALSTTTT